MIESAGLPAPKLWYLKLNRLFRSLSDEDLHRWVDRGATAIALVRTLTDAPPRSALDPQRRIRHISVQSGGMARPAIEEFVALVSAARRRRAAVA